MKRSVFLNWIIVIILFFGFGSQARAMYPVEAPDMDANLAFSSPGQMAHYIVFAREKDGALEPQYYRLVELSMPVLSLDNRQVARLLSQPDRNQQQWVVALQSATGEVVYQNVIQVPRWLRGEFHAANPGESIDGHFFPLEETSFVVRVPVIDGTDLLIKENLSDQGTRFDLDRLAADTTPIDTDALDAAQELLQVSGDPANRVDLLIMGDGYTSAQSSKFASDADAFATQFLGVSPLSTYSNYVNLHTLFTASTQSGADHPPYLAGCSPDDHTCCGDTDMLGDPLRGQMVDTAFDSTFCYNNIHRLLVAMDTSAIYAAAAAVPGWDQIVVLVNDTTYGGSGGAVAVTSLHSSAVQIAQHEYGHSFADLADEYESAYPGYPACSDISGSSPCEVNVTDQTTRSLIKWSPWISSTTPIPTSETDPTYASVVGLFEGARYLTTGMYRPGQNCIMRSLGRPFCQVPSQAYVLKLYNGGWGAPSSGISMIEPGTTSPADSLSLQHPAEQAFQAAILQPIGGSPAQIAWSVNGVPVAGETGNVFTYTTRADQLGAVTIRLDVEDTTSLVNPSMSGGALAFSHTWTVNVTTPLTLTVSAVPDTIVVTDTVGSLIIALLQDSLGGVAGQSTVFTTTQGVLNPLTGVTNASGVVTSTLTCTEVGTATVTASAAGISDSVDVQCIEVARRYLPLVLY